MYIYIYIEYIYIYLDAIPTNNKNITWQKIKGLHLRTTEKLTTKQHDAAFRWDHCVRGSKVMFFLHILKVCLIRSL